jgi:peroxiredoxin
MISKLSNMKKIVYLFIIAAFIASCTTKPHYTVKGKINGSDGTTFILQKREGGKILALDSAVSKNGSFTIKGGAVDYPQMIQFVASGTKKATSFYLENSDIMITGNLDSLYKAVVTGSKTQDEYKSFVDSNKPLSDSYSKTLIEYQAANQTGNVMLIEQLEKQNDSIQTEMTNLQKNFVINHPASYVSPSILGSLSYDMEAAEIESMINAMDSSVAAIPMVIKLKERVAIMKNVSIGKKAPDFTMKDPDDKPVTLSSKIGSKLLLIDFWAAWCNPCRRENPNVVKVYNEFHKKGFDVLGVSLDRKKEEWVKAISDDKLTWTHVSDYQLGNNDAAKMYAVFSIPCNFLLDERGIIIARNLTGRELYNKVNEVLGIKK